MGFPEEESLVFNSSPRNGLVSATGVRRTPSQGAALALAEETTKAMRVEATGQWGRYADMRGSSSQAATLALTEKAAEAMTIETTSPWRPYIDVRRSSSQGVALALAENMSEAMTIETTRQ